MAADKPVRQKLGRNDPCPICHRKMKHCSGHARRISWWVVARLSCTLAILVLFGGLGIVWLMREPRAIVTPEKPVPVESSAAPVPDLAPKIAQLQRVLDEYHRSRPADRWWFTSWPPPPEEFPQTIATCDEIQQRVKTLVAQYRDVSALTREIADVFPHFRTSGYSQGVPVSLLSALDPDQPVNVPGFEICLMPRSEMAQQRSSLWYRRDWRAIMVAGHEWPDVVFAALLYHELGHALRHRQQAPSSFADPGTDLYIDEEMAMYWNEAAVLNAAARGAFFPRLDQIIARQPAVANYQAIITALERNDLEQLDQLFGGPAVTKGVANPLGAAYLMALGQRAIRTRQPENVWVAEERALYHWIEQNFVNR